MIMLLMTIAAARAQVVYSSADTTYPAIYPDYFYYEGNSRLPVVTGPYPQYYLVEKNSDFRFKHDDFNHYDEFIGYKDLDVYYPNEGRVDVLRSEYSQELDLSQINTSMKLFGQHVSGVLPGGAIYTKHYMHDHAWDDEYYGYDYGYYDYSNAYYTPYTSYVNKPVYNHPCQQMSICQATNSCC
jgi:hypothetical protein